MQDIFFFWEKWLIKDGFFCFFMKKNDASVLFEFWCSKKSKFDRKNITFYL